MWGPTDDVNQTIASGEDTHASLTSGLFGKAARDQRDQQSTLLHPSEGWTPSSCMLSSAFFYPLGSVYCPMGCRNKASKRSVFQDAICFC